VSQDTLFLIIGALIFGIALHAYNMGWQTGHDVHHRDEFPDVPSKLPPPPPPTLYR
jgi:sterol desaturase/sphingolipid hydroxylase (fatty acid hydroxylase superfamily)